MANTNYCIYPTQYINWSQGWGPNTSSHASHEDYPFDECCKPMETGETRSWLYCPCDEIEVKVMYGVNNSAHANVIIFQSTSKVLMPCGEDYITFLVIHPEDEDLNSYNVGTKFTRGQQICREGTDASPGITVSGPHFHISCAKGSYNQSMSYYYQFLSSDGYKKITPYEAFYLNDKFTDYNYYTTEFVQAQDISENQFIKLSSVTNNVTAAPASNNNSNNQSNSTTETPSVVTLQKLSTPWKGVDIADSNLTISNLKSMGYEFIISRIGITGQNGNAPGNNMREDYSFERLYQEAKAANFPIGGYWFSCAITKDEGITEAEKVYEYIKGKTFEMPIFIDVEDEGRQEGAGSQAINAAIRGFCDTLANKPEHYLTGFYLGYHFVYDGFIEENNLNQDYVFWLPQWWYDSGTAWTGSATGYADYGIEPKFWQCDGDVKVNSVDNVDNDYCYYDYPSYIKALGYNGYTGTGAVSGESQTVVTKKYYIRVVDTGKVLKEFTSLTDAINYAKEYNINKEEKAKYYVYNEDGTIAYPENVQFYTVTMAATLQNNDSGTKKALLSNAISTADQFLIKFPNKNFYVFNSNKQAVYVASNTEKLYVVRKNPNNLIENIEGAMGAENTQIHYSWFEGTSWRNWIKLEEKQPNTYAVFQVTGENRGKVIYPKEYPYAIYKNNVRLDDVENNPSKNLKTAITTCCNLGFPYEVRNENTKTVVFSLDLDSFSIGDIIKFNKNKQDANYEKEYQIIDINPEFQTITVVDIDNFEEEIKCLLSEIYPLYTSSSGDKNFFINIFYTQLKQKQENDILITTDSPFVSFGDVLQIASSERYNDIYYLKGKLKLPSIQEKFSDEDYYIESSYVTKLI